LPQPIRTERGSGGFTIARSEELVRESADGVGICRLPRLKNRCSRRVTWGIAIHPFLFDVAGERDRPFDIIDRCLDLGCRPRLIGDVALGRGNAKTGSA